MTTQKDSDLRPEVIKVCRQLYNKGLIAAADGNVSVRLSGGDVLITPSGMHKGFLNESDLVVVDSEGHVLNGSGRPSSELVMHTAIYRQDPVTTAVVHTHPPWTLALSLSDNELLPHLLIEGKMFLGEVTTVPFEMPGTEDLARAVVGALHKGPAQILAHHGAVTRGPSLWKAFELMECLEHTSRITALAKMLGEPMPLPEGKI
ncbi:MAG: class II aldolase family protein [Deltaproteobacteria bacterium]|nr:MAG: class II aldolase family protein [Deltaproteobacteria bacterium]